MKEHKHIHRIFSLQCWMVGISPKKVDGKADRWFMDHEWTKRRERVFRILLTLYLRLNKRARREILHSPYVYGRYGWKKCHDAAKEWALQYGWKYKDVKI